MAGPSQPERAVVELTDRRSESSYRVPGRFSIGAVLAFMTAFALLFALLRQLDAPAFLYLFFGSLALIISVGQMIFGNQPRQISVLAGALMLPLCVIAAIGAVRLRQYSSATDLLLSLRWWDILLGLPCITLCGGILGYLTGALAAGIFLLLDRLDQAVKARAKAGGRAPQVTQETVDEGDPNRSSHG